MAEWDYSAVYEQAASSAEVPVVAGSSVAVSPTQPDIMSLIEAVRHAPEAVQTQVVELCAAGLSPQELELQVRAVMEAHGALGVNPMVQTPTGLALADDLGVAAQLQANGQSSFSAQDVALLTARVEDRVQELMAAGQSDQEIQQSVVQMAGNSELAAIAQSVAQQQLDADKFSLVDTRNQPQPATQPLNLFGALPETAAQTEALIAGFRDMGSTTAALAFDPPPPPNVPDVRAALGIAPDRDGGRSV